MPIQVLFVDDEPNLLEITKLFLERDPEIKVSTTDNAGNALNLLDNGHYDVVISDYMMPEMDGLELLSRIRSGGSKIPFIIFTGRGREEVVMEALNLGADFYLQKGGDPRAQFAELRSKVIHAIERQKAEEDLNSAYSELQEAYERSLAGEKALAEKNRLLEESEARFRRLAETTSTAIMLYQDDRYIYSNPATEKMTGYPADEMKQMNFWDVISPECQDIVKERGRKRQMGESTVREYKLKVLTKQGEERWAILQGDTITIEGRPAGLITVTDITGLKEAEDELRRKEEKYRNIFENANDQIFIHEISPESGRAGHILDVNSPALDRLGYSLEELRSMLIFDIIVHKNPDRLERIGSKIAEKGHAIYEACEMAKDGTIVPVEVSTNLINAGGAYTSVTLVRDISERKKAEKALMNEELRFRTLIENLPVGLLQTDREGRIIYLNPKILEMLGSPSEEATREINLLEFPPLQETGVSADIRDAIENRKIVDAERRYVSKWGVEVYLRYKATPLFWDGEVSGVLAILEDVTPRVQAENALRLANHKFSLLSQITRHDIMNNLTAANGYLELLRMDFPEVESEYFDRLADVMRKIRREAEFTRDYQELGAKPPSWQDLNSVIANSVSKAGRTPDGVEIRIDLPRLEIHADPMLEKAISNIIRNSFQHARGMNELTISSHEPDEGELYVLIRDDGPGIPGDEKDSIFYSSYRNRHGHGLFLVKEILDLTGISVSETGPPGTGVCFEIRVPPGRWRRASA